MNNAITRNFSDLVGVFTVILFMWQYFAWGRRIMLKVLEAGRNVHYENAR